MENKVCHCPKCHKLLLNSSNFSSRGEFTIRCAWCQSLVRVNVETHINVALKQNMEEKIFNADYLSPAS